jgi:hypothetical protein
VRVRRVAVVVLIVTFCLIFVPDIGHGFIKDDFAWITQSHVTSVGDVVALFGRNVGFYRPMVSASFAVDHKFWHLDSFGYGLTNLLLFLVDAALLFCLAKCLSLPTAAAALAVGAWAFNFQGVNMALLWISGRTALLLGMFALAAALAVLDRRWIVAGFLSFLAMLSKEEAVLMPLLFVLFEWQRAGRSEPGTCGLDLDSRALADMDRRCRVLDTATEQRGIRSARGPSLLRLHFRTIDRGP